MPETQESSMAPAAPFLSLGLRRRLTLIGIHTALFSLALLLSFGLGFNFRRDPAWLSAMFVPMLPFVLFVKLFVFGLRGEYDVSWRYVSLRDLVNVTIASHISVVIFILGYFVVANIYTRMYDGRVIFDLNGDKISDFRQSVFLLDWAGTIALVSGARMLVRLYHEEIAPGSGSKRTRLLIVGAGNAGESVLREILRMREDRYEVVGFLDDDSAKQGVRIHGVEVLGPTGRIKEIAEAYDIEEILIAIPSATRVQLRRVIEMCEGTSLRFRTVPGIDELINGKVTVSQIRKVRIEDLLGRDPVRLDMDLIGRYIQGRIVMVTGAGGSIGSEMCRQIARFDPANLVLVEQAENPLFEIERELCQRFPGLQVVPYVADIIDRRRLQMVFGREKPVVVFHAAAHKHVPMMERHPGEAVKNNVLGTPDGRRRGRRGRRREVRDDLDRQGGQPDQRDGLHQAGGRDVHPGTQPSQQDALRHRAVRQRPGQQRQRGADLPRPDRPRRPGDRHAPGHDPLLHDHPRGQSSSCCRPGRWAMAARSSCSTWASRSRSSTWRGEMITLSGLRPGEDIEIKFTGVRPGEKLYEELSVSGENFAQTGHEKIFVWRHRREDWDTICRSIGELIASADAATADEIRAKLVTIVPEYDPHKWHAYAGQKDGRPAAADETPPVATADLACAIHRQGDTGVPAAHPLPPALMERSARRTCLSGLPAVSPIPPNGATRTAPNVRVLGLESV